MVNTKVIVNPRTGMMETVDAPDTTDSLAELHREVKDMIEGNKQFHTDPYSNYPLQPTPVDVEVEYHEFDPDMWQGIYP